MAPLASTQRLPGQCPSNDPGELRPAEPAELAQVLQDHAAVLLAEKPVVQALENGGDPLPSRRRVRGRGESQGVRVLKHRAHLRHGADSCLVHVYDHRLMISRPQVPAVTGQ